MLDDLNKLKTFRAILVEGSLSAAARRMGVTLAVVSKRLATLENRAGVRLIHRNTRALSPTEEGAHLLIDIEPALDALEASEQWLAGGRNEPVGPLRASAPISFGRRCVAPVLGQLALRHPRLAVSLELDDRVVDIVGEGLDVVIRIGALADSSAIMRKLADNRRILAAAPVYLNRAGRPARRRTSPDMSSCATGRRRTHGASGGRRAQPRALRRSRDCASTMAIPSTTGRWPASASC